WSSDVCSSDLDVTNGHPGFPQELRRAAGREDLDSERGEAAGELDHTGLVVDGDERAAGFHRMVTVRPASLSRPSANRRMASGYRRCSSTRMRADKDSSVSSA